MQRNFIAWYLNGSRSGDLVVVTAGVPLRVPGSTNILKVQKIE